MREPESTRINSRDWSARPGEAGPWGWGPQPHRDEASGRRAISAEGAPIGADSAVGAGDPNRTAMRPPAEEPSALRKSARLLADARSLPSMPSWPFDPPLTPME